LPLDGAREALSARIRQMGAMAREETQLAYIDTLAQVSRAQLVLAPKVTRQVSQRRQG